MYDGSFNIIEPSKFHPGMEMDLEPIWTPKLDGSFLRWTSNKSGAKRMHKE
jgi:hypothetical protein